MNYMNQGGQFVNVRIFHAATLAQPVDIYVNDRLVIQGLNYRQATNYIPLTKGTYNIKVYASNSGNLLYNESIRVDGNKFITLSAISENGTLELIVVEDETSAFMPMMMPEAIEGVFPGLNSGINPVGILNENMGGYGPDYSYRNGTQKPQMEAKAKVRFIHLSPNAPAVDITLPNGTPLFTEVAYKEASDYIEVNPGNYTLQVRPTGSEQVVLTVPNVVLNPNDINTIYAIGLVNGTPPLEAIILNDGI